MYKKHESRIKEITYGSLAIALMITGGFVIYEMSLIFPIPGIKYILMAPYLSMVIFVLLSKVQRNYILIKFGVVFGLIMILMNIYMGVTIIITTVLTQGSIQYITKNKRPFFGAIFFSMYTGICALLISKYVIGGIFLNISNGWLIITGILCLIFGVIGTVFAKKIMTYFYKNSFY